ncbi:hypothetical protein G7Y89_g13387 [Cudoniella acicularis]|uniref:Rhodopsin domain-containing protein n=1 Tax=Cudoniella acicularis TaxID=354080 RepID=A0A8H4R7J1_9HELO|nr:hypothetical protein G7Y89_g13387 [Cudoniella acicularis]
MNSTTDTIGAFPPPEGTTLNFTDPESIGYRVIIPAVVFPVLAIPFLLARLYAKYFLIKHLHIDDYSIILGWLFALANSIYEILQTRNGLGIHIWDLPIYEFTRFLRTGGTYGSILYNYGTLFTKVSILLFYQRLPADRHFRVVIYVVMFITTGYCLSASYWFLYTCRPIRKFWDPTVPGTCVNMIANYLANAALNAATDIVILILPIWLLWPLRLPARQKLGVTVVLMTGSFVCVVSIIRLAVVPSSLLNSPDFTWNSTSDTIWCIIELYTGIICACLPSLKILAKHHFPQIFTSHNERPDPSLDEYVGSPQQPQPRNNAYLPTLDG